MPASITMALVAFKPKVIGSRIEMPASGPMPGSTPTSVPTRQPRNAYQSTAGCSATEKPRPNDSIAPITFPWSRCRFSLNLVENRCPLFLASLLEPEDPGFERRFERRPEHPPGDHGQSDAVGGGAQQFFAFDAHQQGKPQQRHREDEAEPLIERCRNAGNQHDEQCMVSVAPVDVRERRARLAIDDQHD